MLYRLCYNSRIIHRRKNQAFTIVELLIVVVVIAILAAISIVAYNGITSDAREKALQSELHDVRVKITNYFVDEGRLPESLDEAGVDGEGLYYIGRSNTFCVEGAINGKNFYITEKGALKEGICLEALAPPVACFDFNSTTGTINKYYYYEGGNSNTSSPDCSNDVVIPSTIGGVTVTTLGNASFMGDAQPYGQRIAGKTITSVIIPNTVTTIGTSAFSFNALGSLTIPDSVTSIGGYAFTQNPFTTVTIPASVTSIGTDAFASGSGSNTVCSVPIGSPFTASGIGCLSIVYY